MNDETADRLRPKRKPGTSPDALTSGELQREAVIMEPVAGIFVQVALLAALSASVDLGLVGWHFGVAYAVIVCVFLTLAVRRSRVKSFGLANGITLLRATLVGGVAALVSDGGVDGEVPVTTLLVLAVPALILDAVDGWTARRRRIVSRLGARFDMEVDSFLILVLSIHVSASFGLWVLSIGAMRYVFGVSSYVAPWLGAQLPPSFARKVVAATQGIVLVTVSAGIFPRPVATALISLALASLVWSFGRDVLWLWRNGRSDTVYLRSEGTPEAILPVRNHDPERRSPADDRKRT